MERTVSQLDYFVLCAVLVLVLKIGVLLTSLQVTARQKMRAGWPVYRHTSSVHPSRPMARGQNDATRRRAIINHATRPAAAAADATGRTTVGVTAVGVTYDLSSRKCPTAARPATATGIVCVQWEDEWHVTRPSPRNSLHMRATVQL